jgi:hypothetical protein
VLPFTVNQGGGNLSGSLYDMLRPALLRGSGRKEVDGAKISGHQKLVVTKLGHQSAPLRRRIRPGRGGTVEGRSVRHHCIPGSERQRLPGVALVSALEVQRLSHGLELPFEVEAGDLPLHRADQHEIPRQIRHRFIPGFRISYSLKTEHREEIAGKVATRRVALETTALRQE